jgi:hypothetical protein
MGLITRHLDPSHGWTPGPAASDVQEVVRQPMTDNNPLAAPHGTPGDDRRPDHDDPPCPSSALGDRPCNGSLSRWITRIRAYQGHPDQVTRNPGFGGVRRAHGRLGTGTSWRRGGLHLLRIVAQGGLAELPPTVGVPPFYWPLRREKGADR